MISGVPPTRVATTGTPAAMDSNSEFDNPSKPSDGETATDNAAKTSGTSTRKPVKITRSARPSRPASRLSSSL
jgi:hypothetical protein